MHSTQIIRALGAISTLAVASTLAGCGGGGGSAWPVAGAMPPVVPAPTPDPGAPGAPGGTAQPEVPSAPPDAEPGDGGPTGDAALVLTTQAGPVRGKLDTTTQTLAWLGLPYAKPPVDTLRWKPPVDPEPWTDVRDATRFGASCAQGGRYFSPAPDNAPFGLSVRDGFGKPVGSEDCLTLNVWRPVGSAERLPVLLFIHGGSNISGYSADPIYDGARLAQQANAVVVTINYRLGLFGWLDLPQLKTGDPATDSGNFALLDQIAALRYVQANADVFGGDAANVTVMGESAGAVNVWMLMVSPLAKGLFHKAVSMSGGITTATRSQTRSYADALLKRLLMADGTVPDAFAAERWIQSHSDQETAAYLRAKPAREILTVSLADPQLAAAPAVIPDGSVVPLDPHRAITQGNYQKVSMLASNTREEGKLLGAAFGAFRPTDYDRFTMEYNFDPDAPPTLTEADLLKPEFLPVDRPLTGWNAAASLVTQAGFYQGLATSMTALATQQPDRMWYLRFDWAQQPVPFNTVYGAAHAMDLPFWFGNFGRTSFSFSYSRANRPGREQLSSAMMGTLAAFAHTGNPHHAGLGTAWPNWPATLTFDASPTQARIALE